MSVFVLVSGSWGGGWSWRGVAPLVRQAGHLVYAPTLSGLGERAHVGTAEPVTLLTHIDDVVQLLYFEDLTEVILVGWSYGGGVVDGVADLVPQRLARVVNLDGEVAEEGHLLSEGWTAEAQAEYRGVLEEAKRTGWIAPPRALVSIGDPVLNRWVMERARPHPVGTYTVPYPDRGSARYQVPHTFLRCGTQEGEEPVATALRADSRWSFRELPGVNHLGLLYAPGVIANALLDLATCTNHIRLTRCRQAALQGPGGAHRGAVDGSQPLGVVAYKLGWCPRRPLPAPVARARLVVG